MDWGEIRHFPFTQQSEGRRYFMACRLKYSRWVRVRSPPICARKLVLDASGWPGRGRCTFVRNAQGRINWWLFEGTLYRHMKAAAVT